MTPAAIVQKLWNYCNVLRDDGMSYGDYVEQLTFLLFLKMADERTKKPYSQKSPIPAGYDWPSLLKKDGDDLFDHYRHTLEKLGQEKGLLGLIFGRAQNKFQDPAKLRRLLVDPLDKENWSIMKADVKGEAYEGLLEKNAQDTKSGAGQYFTPRPLIKAMVDVMAPRPKETVCDPACGTGGFLFATHEYVTKHHKLDREQKLFLDSKTLLKQHGRAAVVVPDNVLFEGGAGETIRRKLLQECDVHTLLRLPTGLFYAQGVKANVIFFDKKPARETPWTKKLWIYDLRTNLHFTLKTNPLQRKDLDEFVTLYNPPNRHERKTTWSEDNPSGRWRAYDYADLMARDKASLDIFWLRDESLEDSDNLPEPGVICRDIIADLESALEQLRLIAEDVGEEEIL